jgi:hypothetical protein
MTDPERVKASRLAAIDEIERMARRRPFTTKVDVVQMIRDQRRERDAQIAANIRRTSER